MKDVVILGSTGSIGENALRVVRRLPDRLRVVGLGARRNVARLLEQAQEFGVRRVAVADPAAAREAAARAPRDVAVEAGEAGMAALAAQEADVVLCAVVGMAGLRPVMAAIARGTDVALATKEALVSAGALVTAAAAARGVRLLPVDSEHSAIFQCVEARPRHEIGRLILTASGGPFDGRPDIDFRRVTVREALDHPRWAMGRKVTVDSATLMNKGLEVMEAHWLFGVPYDRIEVVVHPESIVHSLVEFVDGSVMAQMSVPDMRFAIQHALTHPERIRGGLPELDLAATGALHFRRPDTARFPCLRLALEAARRGGTLPAVLNAANEVAVGRFLEGRSAFARIWEVIEAVMERHATSDSPGLEDVMAADEWARAIAMEVA